VYEVRNYCGLLVALFGTLRFACEVAAAGTGRPGYRAEVWKRHEDPNDRDGYVAELVVTYSGPPALPFC
jgi:hypothetical protein